MNDEDKSRLYEQGAARLAEVYAGTVPAMPEGTMEFVDVMNRTLFAQVWDRDHLSVRDCRLLLMGVIAAQGERDVWRNQSRAALERGELDVDALRETLVFLAPYAGYPHTAGLIGPTEDVIEEWTEHTGEA